MRTEEEIKEQIETQRGFSKSHEEHMKKSHGAVYWHEFKKSLAKLLPEDKKADLDALISFYNIQGTISGLDWCIKKKYDNSISQGELPYDLHIQIDQYSGMHMILMLLLEDLSMLSNVGTKPT